MDEDASASAGSGHISVTQKKQPEWLNQYRYNTQEEGDKESGGRKASTGYSQGAGFNDTQLDAGLPGAVDEDSGTETVAVQLLRTKLEQGAIDRLEFEHIRAVMLRSMAMTDGAEVAVAVTDV